MTRRKRPKVVEHRMGEILHARMEYIRARRGQSRTEWLDRAIFAMCLADEAELAERERPRARYAPEREAAE